MKQSNKVYLHCQDNKLRSVVFLAGYLLAAEEKSDIGQALIYVNGKLKMEVEDQRGTDQNDTIQTHSQYHSQHLFLKNLANYLNDRNFINRNQLKLNKILVNCAPKIKFGANETINFNDANVKILLEIKAGEKLIHRSVHPNSIIEG